MIKDKDFSDDVYDYYDACESFESTLTLFLEGIISEQFEIIDYGFDDGLFYFKIKTVEIYGMEMQELKGSGFELQKKTEYKYINQYIFKEVE